MATNKYFIPLTDIYNDFLLSIEDSDYISSVNHALVWSTMKKGAREFVLDVNNTGVAKTVKLTVMSTSAIALPSDCMQVTKVGFLDGDGLIYQLKESGNIGLQTGPTNGFSTGQLEEGFDDLVFHNYLLDGNYGQLYGMGGGKTYGEYRVNWASGNIELDTSNSYTEVYVEYIADPVGSRTPDVHIFAEEPIRLYTYYKLISNKSNVPGGEKARARKEYFNELRRAKSRFTVFNKQEAMAISRKNFRLSPKS